MEDKIKNFKYLEEFELVDNSKQEVYNDKESKGKNKTNIEITGGNKTYREKDVYIEPVFKSATSTEYNVYLINEKNELEQIGMVREDKQIVLTAKYKERKRLELGGKEFDFDSKNLEVDMQKMFEEQRLRDERRKADKESKDNKVQDLDENKEKAKEEEKEEVKEKDEEEKNKEIDNENLITDEDLKKQGYDIDTYTRITNRQVIDSMIVENYNPNSMIVAEVDNDVKFLAKEAGTGEIKELPIKRYDNTIEEVNEFENNVERSRGAGAKITLKNCPGMEFNVNKNRMGQLEVGLIGNIDEQGNREVIQIGSPVHPTEQEYRRAEAEKYERYGYGQILTKDEVDTRLAQEVESIRDEVGQEIETMAKNPTLQELEEKIQNEKDKQKQEKEHEEEEERDDEEEYEKVPWDRHPHP